MAPKSLDHDEVVRIECARVKRAGQSEEVPLPLEQECRNQQIATMVPSLVYRSHLTSVEIPGLEEYFLQVLRAYAMLALL